ncbi:3-oxoacyl-ACP synthase III family protein [Nocardiopsis sp. FIRDI 009]|uniref:3-oxoacyl-ACP synthase III family protein n=1 Tax=Nocardiopsis sp. FIRDI 009 TaxID=714197 RepID=UPI000E24CB0F|nr:ketoacyl-ACP synthase III [Nocardiopsis sp. FIRDI 009]
MPTGILSIGGHVPERVVDNPTVADWSGTTPEWIAERTGVMERRYAEPGTATSDMALPAAREALAGAPDGRTPTTLVVATCTPDVPQPSTAAILQAKLGLPTLAAFDVNAVCSGFLYGLTVADALLRERPDERALVVGADMFSRIMNRSDRRTVSLFGDGAGAVVLGHVPEGYGIQGGHLVADGEYHRYVGVDAGGTALPLDEAARESDAHLFHMDGRSVREYALSTLDKLVHQTLDDAGLGLGDIDRFVFHQANTRLLTGFADEAGIDPARMTLTAPRLGNTAAASVPLTLAAAHAERPLQRGERLLFAAVGGGMTAATTLMTWY